jgi:hypothetical protein
MGAAKDKLTFEKNVLDGWSKLLLFDTELIKSDLLKAIEEFVQI